MTSISIRIHIGSTLVVTFSTSYTKRADTPLYTPFVRTFVSSVAQSGFQMRNAVHANVYANAQSLRMPQAYLTLGCE